MRSLVIGQTYNSDSILGVPIRIGNLEVAQFDFPSKINRDYAEEECQSLGKGWRLPTIAELNLLLLIYTKKALVVLAIPLIGVTASLKTRTGEWICPSMMEL